MRWKLTEGAFRDLTDHTFTRAQVLRIIRELDALALEVNPCHPEFVDVDAVKSLPDGQYRLKIQEADLRCRIMFSVPGKDIIVWACLTRCDRTYDIARILFDARKVGV